MSSVRKIYDAFLAPGWGTEFLYFFVAEYSDDMKVSDGGGCATEQENIEVLEIPFKEAIEMVANGAINDAKTIMLIQYAQINHLVGQ